MLRGVKHEIAKLVDEAKQDATGAKWSKPSIVIAILTGLIALAALYKTWITARNQSTDEKKRLVLLILERIDKLAAINWDGPDPSDVRKAINALGLISICWRNNMVDRKLTALMFGELFQRYVREFDTHRDVQIKQYNKTVAELLGAELCGLQQVAEEIRKIH